MTGFKQYFNVVLLVLIYSFGLIHNNHSYTQKAQDKTGTENLKASTPNILDPALCDSTELIASVSNQHSLSCKNSFNGFWTIIGKDFLNKLAVVRTKVNRIICLNDLIKPRKTAEIYPHHHFW